MMEQMLESLTAIRNLAAAHDKYAPEQIVFDQPTTFPTTTYAREEHAMHSSASSDSAHCTLEYPSFESSGEPVAAKVIDYRGEKVACFELNGIDMICLPQVYDLFLRNLVGGLHTVYTKLKRLDITPIVCNVEQVRALRSLGAIQPGVNRCKLIATADFEKLYEDCTNSPGRPPKRTTTTTMDDWGSTKLQKFSGTTSFEGASAADFTATSPTSFTNSQMFLGQLFPSFTAQQLLMQQMMAVAAAQKDAQQQIHNTHLRRDDVEEEVSLSSTLGGTTTSDTGIPLNLTKSQENSETSDNDSMENMRKNDLSVSPNQSMSDRGRSSGSCGGSSTNQTTPSSASDQSGNLLNKILSLVDMANDHFKQQREWLQKEREEVEGLRTRVREHTDGDGKIRDALERERRKSRSYSRRLISAKREALSLKERLLEMQRQREGMGTHLSVSSSQASLCSSSLSSFDSSSSSSKRNAGSSSSEDSSSSPDSNSSQLPPASS